MKHVPFALENDLCAVLARHLGSVLHPGSGAGQTRTLTQRPVGTVIPDFIYIRSQRLAGTEPKALSAGLTALEASIVATLVSGRSLRDVTIARQLYSRVERIAPRLKALERLGIIRQSTEGVFALRRGALPRAAHVVAVEAKLRRWREAIAQATCYLAFATQAYVALPREIITGNDGLRSAAISARVGLLAVVPDGVEIMRVAPHHRTRTADWIWLLSRNVPLTASRTFRACSSRTPRTPFAIPSGG